MSVCSDDTDVLLIIPPDLFTIKDANLEPESEAMKRSGSTDALLFYSKPVSSPLPRSLHSTPNKTRRNNMLTCEPYLSQKTCDEQNLRDINEYFTKRRLSDDSKPIMDLQEVQNVVRDIQQTQKELRERLNSESVGEESIRSARRLLNFGGDELTVETSTFRSSYEEVSVLRQRIDEERCRRRHCEKLIQELQQKVLQRESDLAVQSNLNKEKDAAIASLKNNWDDLSSKWKEMEERNRVWEDEKLEMKLSAKRYEDELSKALDLAHGYKEKCESAVKEQKIMKAELGETKKKMASVEDERIKLVEQLRSRDDLLNQTRAKLSETRQELKTLKEVQIELKAEIERLNQRLEVSQKREKTIEDQNERIKAELKKFYQGQVESIVQEKQREFQQQLLAAEKSLQKQHDTKQHQLTEQMKQLIEKHTTEVHLLERKHSEENHLWEIRFKEKEEKLTELTKKIRDQSWQQTVLVEKLHAVVESQWQQTLNILVNGSDNDSLKKPVYQRQGTFTKEEEELKCSTYRVNSDTSPHKIAAQQPALGHYINKLLEKKMNESLNSSLEEIKTSPTKHPWKP